MILVVGILSPVLWFRYNILVPPNQGEQDYQWPPQGLSRISGQESDMYIIIDFVSQHLIFFIAVIAFLAVLYTGYMFITKGPDEGVQAGKNLVTGLGIAVFIAVFSYAFVRLVTNLI